MVSYLFFSYNNFWVCFVICCDQYYGELILVVMVCFVGNIFFFYDENLYDYYFGYYDLFGCILDCFFDIYCCSGDYCCDKYGCFSGDECCDDLCCEEVYRLDSCVSY